MGSFYYAAAVLILGLIALGQVQVHGGERDARSLLSSGLGAVTSGLGLDNALSTTTKALGVVESAVSPEALMSFCNDNGFTVWIGRGPRPEAPSGLLGKAASGWGSLTGAAVSAWLPESGMVGKCEGAGWAKPGSVPVQYQQGSPGPSVTYVQGSPGSVQYQPGTQGSIQYQPGTQGTTTYVQGTPSSVQYQPGTQGSVQYQPGTPASVQYQQGTPGTTVQYQQGTPAAYTVNNPPPQQQMCSCPCNG